MGNTRRRLLSADLLKLSAIFLVLWGHCLQQFLGNGNILENSVYLFIYSFHMPLFMVISGYFSVKSLILPFRETVSKKARQLLLPTFSWSIFIFLIYMAFANLVPECYPITSAGVALSKAFDNFWFLKSLFLCYMIAWCGKNSGLSVSVWVILSLAASQIFPLYNVKVMYPCFLFGMAIKHYSYYIERHRVPLFLSSLSIFIIMSLFWDGDFIKPANLIGAIRNGETDNAMFMLFARFYRVSIGISASLSLYILFTGLFDGKYFCSNPILNRLSEFGTYTLGIYILQVVVLEIVLGTFINCDSLNIYIFQYIVAPLSSVAIMLFCIFIYKFICRYRFLSFVLFGNPLPCKE